MITLEQALEPRFLAGVVCAVVGVKPVTLRAWRHRKIVKIGRQQDGWTKYSYLDLFQVAIVHLATQNGTQAEEASKFAKHCAYLCIGSLSGDKDFNPRWAVMYRKADHYTESYAQNPSELKIFADLPQPFGYFIDIDETVKTVMGQLGALQDQDVQES